MTTKTEAEALRRAVVAELEVDQAITRNLKRALTACDEGITDATTDEQRDYLASIVMVIRKAGTLLNTSIDMKSARLVELSKILEGADVRNSFH